MDSKKIFSMFLVSTLVACAGGSGKEGLSERSLEQRCLELEHKWDIAQQDLAYAEERANSSWLYQMADTFNPLTNSSDESLSRAKAAEQRAHENYAAFGCLDLSKGQIKSSFNIEQPAQEMLEQKTASFDAGIYQIPPQN